MRAGALPTSGLFTFSHPYEELEPVELGWNPEPPAPGSALVWFTAPVATIYPELDWVRERPRDLPLFVVLPEPEDILPIAPILRSLNEVGPRAALPSVGRGFEHALKTVLAAPPRSIPRAVADQLEDAGLIPDQATREIVEKILAAAPNVTSIQKLADRLCQSRRTVGRFFHDRNLPVPSHWLQFARILHVAIQIQNTRHNLNRTAVRFAFPDGFTMSNTMKRLIGYRPSFVRERLGWEWIVEAWLRQERRGS